MQMHMHMILFTLLCSYIFVYYILKSSLCKKKKNLQKKITQPCDKMKNVFFFRKHEFYGGIIVYRIFHYDTRRGNYDK